MRSGKTDKVFVASASGLFSFDCDYLSSVAQMLNGISVSTSSKEPEC